MKVCKTKREAINRICKNLTAKHLQLKKAVSRVSSTILSAKISEVEGWGHEDRNFGEDYIKVDLFYYGNENKNYLKVCKIVFNDTDQQMQDGDHYFGNVIKKIKNLDR